MSQIRYHAISTDDAVHYRSGGADAYGMPPDKRVSDGSAIPCRHCLNFVAEGEAYLEFAHRPFSTLQAYAETGPIFIHADACERYEDETKLPPVLKHSPDYIMRGYSADDRIVYGTGAVTPIAEMQKRAEELLARADIAYVHVRSARNNCYQARIDRE